MKNGTRTEIKIGELMGAFAEDKDRARNIRVQSLIPALTRGEKIILNFGGVDVATQSFVHALISEPVRSLGATALDLIEFKSCTPAVRNVILTVVEYSLTPIVQ